MNINKDGKTLYFSDEEIDNNQDGEKKVFVTKRINGKESHIKIDKTRKNNPRHLKHENSVDEDIFSFNDEIVIGVNKSDNTKEKSPKNKKKKRKNSKEYKKKKLKNRKPNKFLMAIATTIAFVIVIAILALTAPAFNIIKINVTGNEKVSAETIISLSGLKKGENIFKFNSLVTKKIKENPYIQEAKVKRKLPGTVEINVKERKIKYQLNLINSYTYIDKDGYILENSEVKEKVPVITGLSITEDKMLNGSRLEEKDIAVLNKITKIIDAAKTIDIDSLITEVNIENDSNTILYLENENKKIHIGDISNLTNKMLYIKKILEDTKGHSGIIFVDGDINSGFKPRFREE